MIQSRGFGLHVRKGKEKRKGNQVTAGIPTMERRSGALVPKRLVPTCSLIRPRELRTCLKSRFFFVFIVGVCGGRLMRNVCRILAWLLFNGQRAKESCVRAYNNVVGECCLIFVWNRR